MCVQACTYVRAWMYIHAHVHLPVYLCASVYAWPCTWMCAHVPCTCTLACVALVRIWNWTNLSLFPRLLQSPLLHRHHLIWPCQRCSYWMLRMDLTQTEALYVGIVHSHWVTKIQTEKEKKSGMLYLWLCAKMKTFSYCLELYIGIKIISPVPACIFLLLYVTHVGQHCPKNVFLVKQKLHRKLLNLTFKFSRRQFWLAQLWT